MKKTVMIIAALLLCVSLSGCDMIKDKYHNIVNKGASVGDKINGEAEEKRSTYDGADIDFVACTNHSLTVKITNNSTSTWQSGNMRDYSLEMQKDGEWYEVKQIGEFANTMELMIFSPGEEMTHTFEFGDRYGQLSAGRYRVVKSYWANATDTSEAREFYLWCEFGVE